jgi:hypothetical protein
VSRWLNAIGLIFGMVGIVLIFIWGPPQPSFESGVSIGLQDNTQLSNGKTVAQNNAEIAAKKTCYKLMYSIGLGLIGVGFFLQLCSIAFQ